MESFNTLDWIRGNADILSINKIEIILKMPQGTLQKAISESRNLAKQWEKPLDQFILDRLKPALPFQTK